MTGLLKAELYKISHNRGLIVILVIFCIMTVYMGGLSLDREVKKIQVVYEKDFGSEKAFIEEATKDAWGLGYPAYFRSKHSIYSDAFPAIFIFESNAGELFKPGGKLYEKYKDYGFIDKMIPMQEIDGSYFLWTKRMHMEFGDFQKRCRI